METVDTFEPDQELLDFADYFSKNWKTLPIGFSTEQSSGGDHFSIGNKYHIRYVDRIIDKLGTEPPTNIRISQSTGIIDISKSRLDALETNSDFLFFFILWCIVEKDVKNVMKTDIITMNYYVGTGRSIKNVLAGYVGSFQHTEYTFKRVNALIKWISSTSKP